MVYCPHLGLEGQAVIDRREEVDLGVSGPYLVRTGRMHSGRRHSVRVHALTHLLVVPITSVVVTVVLEALAVRT